MNRGRKIATAYNYEFQDEEVEATIKGDKHTSRPKGHDSDFKIPYKGFELVEQLKMKEHK